MFSYGINMPQIALGENGPNDILFAAFDRDKCGRQHPLLRWHRETAKMIVCCF
jgi:hypothetical protein